MNLHKDLPDIACSFILPSARNCSIQSLVAHHSSYNKQYVNLIPQICPVSTGIPLSCIPEALQRPRRQDVQTGQRQARPAPMVGQPGGLGSGGLPSLCGTANRNKPEKSEDFFLKSKFTLSRTRLILCL